MHTPTQKQNTITFEINEIPPTPALDAVESQILPEPRSRVGSLPCSKPLSIGIPSSQPFPTQSPSAGPYRTTFAVRPPNNGHALRPSLSAPSHSAHSRTVSGSYSNLPPLPSPLSTSSTRQWSDSSSPAAHTPQTFTFPAQNATSEPQRSPTVGRRHNRIHSRNLSVFFPRPGTLPHSSIAEDGAVTEAPPILMPHVGEQSDIREGFTFGGQPPLSDNSIPPSHSLSGSRTTRRGHHHKHSMSHNFFSFLEPGANPPSAPVTPSSSMTAFPPDERLPTPPSPPPAPVPPVQTLAVVASIAEFFLGASMWVSGQQTGSLSCTGLGYWAVFDAFGIALSRVLPGYLAKGNVQPKTRTYGNGRLETVMMFAQSVYLIFSSVYVCKETVEHLLLSGGADMHHHADHHHHSNGIGLPSFLTLITLLFLVGSALMFDNHTKLVQVTGRQLPQLTSLLPSTRTSFSILANKNQPDTPLDLLLSNPFSVSPIVFALAIMMSAFFLPESQQRQFDVLLAGVEAAVTFSVAYPAAVALGSVLLQTSPARGSTSGRMESFLRAMKEIERHPQVLHLPPPHIWQLTPSIPSKQTLVVTMELHVRKELSDEDILKLTKWAWERCVSGLGFGRRAANLPEGNGMPEVTVGIVKG